MILLLSGSVCWERSRKLDICKWCCSNARFQIHVYRDAAVVASDDDVRVSDALMGQIGIVYDISTYARIVSMFLTAVDIDNFS